MFHVESRDKPCGEGKSNGRKLERVFYHGVLGAVGFYFRIVHQKSRDAVIHHIISHNLLQCLLTAGNVFQGQIFVMLRTCCKIKHEGEYKHKDSRPLISNRNSVLSLKHFMSCFVYRRSDLSHRQSTTQTHLCKKKKKMITFQDRDEYKVKQYWKWEYRQVCEKSKTKYRFQQIQNFSICQIFDNFDFNIYEQVRPGQRIVQ